MDNIDPSDIFELPVLIIPSEDLETVKKAGLIISETASKLKELNIPSFCITTIIDINGKPYISNFTN